MLLVSRISCEARKLLLRRSFSVPTFFTLPISSLSNNINTPQNFDKTAFGYEIYGLCFLSKKKKPQVAAQVQPQETGRDFISWKTTVLTKCSYQ